MREITLTVRGDTVHASRHRAGIQGEANATALVVAFDESWDGYAKKITFWDALEQNPVVRILTDNLRVDGARDGRTYKTTIPGEPLALAGECLLVIDGYVDGHVDGYVDGTRARSMSVRLTVEEAPVADNAGTPADPMPEPYEQIQEEIEVLSVEIQTVYQGVEEVREIAQRFDTVVDGATEAINKAIDKANTAEQAAAEHKKDAETAAVLAEGYTSHPPVIGENENWWEWNGEAYVDTGKPSRGKQGEKGDPGAIGDVPIAKGSGANSVVIGEGDADGRYSIAGGTADKTVVTDITGVDIDTIPDSTLVKKLGERGPTIKSMVENPANAIGDAGISYGVGCKSVTASSIAIGIAAQAGARGFYIHKVTFAEGIIINLSTEQKPYCNYTILGATVGANKTATWTNEAKTELLKLSAGDIVNIVFRDSSFCAAIDSVDADTGSIVIEDTGAFTQAEYDSEITFEGLDAVTSMMGALLPHNFSVSVLQKPSVGIGDLYFAGIATGFGTIAAGTLSEAHGTMSEAIGNNSFAEGRQTLAVGAQSHAEGRSTQANGLSSHAEGDETTAIGKYSHTEGLITTANGVASHAEGGKTKSVGNYSHAEGWETTATGNFSHAEGIGTSANGNDSHAEGYHTTAEGAASHAEGNNTTAIGRYSHAEGLSTRAGKDASHAEGSNTIADGVASHAEGYCTVAAGNSQHVHGRYNVEDTNDKYATIVGNGSSSARSNAHTLDWDGNAWFAGTVDCNRCLIGGKELSQTYTATLPTTGWGIEGTDPYYSTIITVPGISANDNPVVDFVGSDDMDSNWLLQQEFSKVVRIGTRKDEIYVMAIGKPNISIPIQLKVVR